MVPAERLLDYKLGDGWEPLCEFLGKDAPSEEFPRLNEEKVMKERIMRIQKEKFLAGSRAMAFYMGPFVAVGLRLRIYAMNG